MPHRRGADYIRRPPRGVVEDVDHRPSGISRHAVEARRARTSMILAAIAMAALVILIGAPLTGWPALVRLDAVLVPALALSAASLRPWRWTDSQWQAIEAWTPSPRVVVCGAVALGAALFWFVLTRFESGSINAVDFTVYFDRPCFQTVHGRPLFVETGSFPP